MTPEFLLVLAAFGVVLWLTVIFTRRRTTQHDNSFVSRTETPHVVPAAAMSVMNGQTITFQQDDQQTFVPQGGDSGGAGASDTWAPADDDQQQQADPEPDPEPESDDQ